MIYARDGEVLGVAMTLALMASAVRPKPQIGPGLPKTVFIQAPGYPRYVVVDGEVLTRRVKGTQHLTEPVLIHRGLDRRVARELRRPYTAHRKASIPGGRRRLMARRAAADMTRKAAA